LVVLDVDSTLIENEVIDLLAAAAGSLTLVSAITERAMRGELDFEQSLRERVRALAGLKATAFAQVLDQIEVTRGVPELISRLHAAGSKIGAVSGGFHVILDPIAEKLGLDFWAANRFEIVEETLTGELAGPIIHAQAKADKLSEWAKTLGLPLSQTVAIGDGANDLLMMKLAGLSVAFDAKPAVRAAADVRLDNRDLSSVLALIGLRG
jgi:phosphoserine phosphatase